MKFLFPILLLAGCASLNPFAASGPPDTPEQAECRRSARDTPEAREIQQTLSIGNNDRIIGEQVAAARERAFRRCLRERRLPGAGGIDFTPPPTR